LLGLIEENESRSNRSLKPDINRTKTHWKRRAILITFFLDALDLSASQELVKLATILILLSVVWKLGSKITRSIFWFLILAQFMSLVNPS
jgi:hypothetical protein